MRFLRGTPIPPASGLRTPRSSLAKRSAMNLDNREKTRAIDIAVSQIEKQFGKGSIMKLGSRETVEVPTIPTGALSIDWALGVGGFPRGRILEIFGPESSGKTT